MCLGGWGWRWGQKFGVVHGLSVLGINMGLVIPSIVHPSRATRLKVSCSFSYRSGVKKSEEKEWLHFYGNWTLQPFVLTKKLCLPSLYLGARETEGGTWKKRQCILASKTIMGSPVWLSLLGVFFILPKTRANNRGSKLTFASFLVTASYTF